MKLTNKSGATVGATQMGGLLAQVGGSLSFAVWNMPSGKLLHEDKTPVGLR
jgi:hypothetical protein